MPRKTKRKSLLALWKRHVTAKRGTLFARLDSWQRWPTGTRATKPSPKPEPRKSSASCNSRATPHDASSPIHSMRASRWTQRSSCPTSRANRERSSATPMRFTRERYLPSGKIRVSRKGDDAATKDSSPPRPPSQRLSLLVLRWVPLSLSQAPRPRKDRRLHEARAVNDFARSQQSRDCGGPGHKRSQRRAQTRGPTL